MIVCYNGKIIAESEVVISIHNRGLNYGDGLFETIIARDLNIYFFEDHLDRLSAGLKALNIEIPNSFSISNLQEILFKLIKQNNIVGLSRIKIQVWRKAGGLFSATSKEAEYLITTATTELNFIPREKVLFFDQIRLSYSPISRFKKLSSLHYVMAGIFKNESKADDVILLDVDGNIAECLASNIYWVKDNSIFTPSLETGCIEGTMQKQIKKFFLAKGISLIEGKYQKEVLEKADSVIISNVAGINLIKKIESTSYHQIPTWFNEMQDLLKL